MWKCLIGLPDEILVPMSTGHPFCYSERAREKPRFIDFEATSLWKLLLTELGDTRKSVLNRYSTVNQTALEKDEGVSELMKSSDMCCWPRQDQGSSITQSVAPQGHAIEKALLSLT
jgi:hypothetical protein